MKRSCILVFSVIMNESNYLSFSCIQKSNRVKKKSKMQQKFKKKCTLAEFYDQSGLLVDLPEQNHGSSNDGNTAWKTNSAVCSLATVASRLQSVRSSNCHILEGVLLVNLEGYELLRLAENLPNCGKNRFLASGMQFVQLL